MDNRPIEEIEQERGWRIVHESCTPEYFVIEALTALSKERP